MVMDHWTDSHNHLQDPRIGDPDRALEVARHAGVTRCIVNATREEDWCGVDSLCARFPESLSPAFGIHPWHAATATDGWLDRLRARLLAHPCASIGECGLDRWVSQPSIDHQIPVFRDQLRLARETRRPLTIHCLKAWGVLLEMLTEIPPPAGFLMHSYGGSIETARQLLPLGARFSFSGYFLHPRKAAVREVFRQLPPDRILIETDAPDMLPPDAWPAEGHGFPANHPGNLPAIGRGLAEVLGIGTPELARLTRTNAAALFQPARE